MVKTSYENVILYTRLRILIILWIRLDYLIGKHTLKKNLYINITYVLDQNINDKRHKRSDEKIRHTVTWILKHRQKFSFYAKGLF